MPTIESPVIVSPRVTVKLVADVPIPSVVVSTRIGPVVAKGGTVAVIVLEERVLILANTPLNVTLLTFVKLVPEIATVDILGPDAGLKLVMVGTGCAVTKVVADTADVHAPVIVRTV
jgi:hypothetical protein